MAALGRLVLHRPALWLTLAGRGNSYAAVECMAVMMMTTDVLRCLWHSCSCDSSRCISAAGIWTLEAGLQLELGLKESSLLAWQPSHIRSPSRHPVSSSIFSLQSLVPYVSHFTDWWWFVSVKSKFLAASWFDCLLLHWRRCGAQLYFAFVNFSCGNSGIDCF